MTFSHIISAAAAAPDSAATDPAGTAVPGPVVAPDSASPTGQSDSAAGSADRGAYPADQADAAAEQGGYPATGEGGYSAAGQGGYPVTGQGGYPATEHGAYSAGQEGYSGSSAGPATDAAQQDEAGAAWPHQTFLELGALATAAPCARLHATLVLWEWELGTLVHSVGLVVSELVSNAVQASAGLTGSRFAGYWAPGTPPVRVWLSADDHRVVIQVWDGSDRPPMPQPVEPEADSGRGLLLVGALCEEWGCYTPDKSSGKVVWAVVTA